MSRTFGLSRESQREALIAYIRSLKLEPPIKVEVSKWAVGPTREQYARYWKLVRMVSEKVLVDTDRGKAMYVPDAWDEYFSNQWLDHKIMPMPFGPAVERRISKTELDEPAMDRFVERVREFAAEHDIHLEPPPEGD